MAIDGKEIIKIMEKQMDNIERRLNVCQINRSSNRNIWVTSDTH
jgi:hypothetical protein